MKLAFFNDYKLGVAKGDSIVDVSDVVSDLHAHSPQDLLRALIENFSSYRGKLEEAAASRQGTPLAQVDIKPPVPKPYSIVAMAVNYMEDGTRDAPAPINAFLKPASSVIGDGDTMVLEDIPASIFEAEAEMAMVVGKLARNVPAENWADYIFGYTNFIDGSARGLQPGGGNTFYQMKARDTYCPMGPFIVTADEISDPQNLQVRLWVNENLTQNYNTNDMAHQIPRVVEWASSCQTLEPGDVIATGTNHRGLSAFQDGDKIEMEVEGLGRLHFNVRDDLKRTWSRETRLDMQNKGIDGTTPQLTGKYAKS